MKNNLSEKILCFITIFLIITTLLLSLAFSPKKGVLVFFFVFSLIYWQKKQLQDFFQKIKNPKTGWVIYLLTGWLGAIFLEFSLGISPFHPRPIANYLIGLGFYLPYFAIWRTFIRRYQFSLSELFYLSGLSRVIFDLVITRKLLITAATTTYFISAFLVFTIQTIATFTIFGMLTTLPALYLTRQEVREYNKPLKHYLLGLTPNFLAAGVLVVWTIILKIIFA